MFEVQVLRTMLVDYTKATAFELYVAKLAADLKPALSVKLQSLIRGQGIGRTVSNSLLLDNEFNNLASSTSSSRNNYS